MTTSNTSRVSDVAVIGAGVFGAWTAYWLRQSGKRVILIDAFGAGNDHSSSGDQSRIIRMGYGADEIYTRWAQRALGLWQEFFARIDEPLFHRTGVLWLAHDDDPYAAKCDETLAKVGIVFEKLTRLEIAKRYPQLALDNVAWAMLEPESGALYARRAVQAVVRESIKRGVVYHQELVRRPTGARSLDFIVTESGERISANTYVFACGAWLPKLFPRLLGDRIHTTRQEVFYFDAGSARRLFSVPALPIWIDFGDAAYGFPLLEDHGVKVAIDRHGPSFDPDAGDRVAGSDGLAEVRRYLALRVPLLKDAPVTEARVCQYENTWNGDFLIDRHPTFENVWLVGGGSGHGFKHGPVVGEYVADQINGTATESEPRFALAAKKTKQERAVF